MENTFIQELEQALTENEKELNTVILPSALESYNNQTSSCKMMRSLLLKKRLIHNDPYKYDNNMTEIEVPDNSPFTDMEAAGAIGSRFAQYEMMLDFLVNSYQFNTSFLTVARLAKLKALNDTFTWQDFSAKSKSLNTKALFNIVEDVFYGADAISATVLKSCFSNMAKGDEKISSAFKTLLYFHKQKYKLAVRKNIMDCVKISEADMNNSVIILREVKKIFPQKMRKYPFYPELILEAFKEDYGPESETLRNNILKNLSPAKKETKTEKKQSNFRPLLISAIQNIGNTYTHFVKVLEKIRANRDLIIKSDSGLLSKIAKCFRTAFNIKDPYSEIILFTTDPITQSKKKEKIIYEVFEKNLVTKINIFHSFMNPSESVKNKIRSASNKELLAIISRYITDANNLINQLNGLDEFFKTVRPELRSKIKGIKIEITTIENYLLKANQNKAEYITYHDEMEQMKQLEIE